MAAFVHGYSARRRQALVDVIRAGIEAGELPTHLDSELAALALAGPVIYCRTMTPNPLPVARTRQLVSQVLGP